MTDYIEKIEKNIGCKVAVTICHALELQLTASFVTKKDLSNLELRRLFLPLSIAEWQLVSIHYPSAPPPLPAGPLTKDFLQQGVKGMGKPLK